MLLRIAMVLSALICAAGPAAATVTYTFTSPVGDFRWTTSAFLAGPAIIPVGALDYCRPSVGSCGSPRFNAPLLVGTPAAVDEEIIFSSVQPFPLGSLTTLSYNYFQRGALRAFGSYRSFGPSGASTLTVSPGVPEPASWALLIAGLGISGAALRRRRAGPGARLAAVAAALAIAVATPAAATVTYTLTGPNPSDPLLSWTTGDYLTRAVTVPGEALGFCALGGRESCGPTTFDPLGSIVTMRTFEDGFGIRLTRFFYFDPGSFGRSGLHVYLDYDGTDVPVPIAYLDVAGPPPAGVPEPASWALMIAGFGVAGAAQRRRRGTYMTEMARPCRG